VVGEGLTTVVATAVVVGAGGGLAATAFLGLAVVVVAALAVVVVVGAVVVGSTDVVVSSTSDVDMEESSAAVPAALPLRRMAGSLLRWGTPAMATPTAAHTTSMSTVTDRCPGLTAGLSRKTTVRPMFGHFADADV